VSAGTSQTSGKTVDTTSMQAWEGSASIFHSEVSGRYDEKITATEKNKSAEKKRKTGEGRSPADRARPRFFPRGAFLRGSSRWQGRVGSIGHAKAACIASIWAFEAAHSKNVICDFNGFEVD